MRESNDSANLGKLKLILGCLFITMLVFSKFATSSCIIFLILLAFYNIFFSNGQWTPLNAKKEINAFFKQPAFWGLTLVFWIIVLGYLNSENLSYWLSRVRLRLPFLALPVVFFLFPWNKNEKDKLILFSIGLIFLVSSGVVINYIFNYESMSQLIKTGSSIPVPMKDHVRYAQLEAFVFLGSIYWLINNQEKAWVKNTVFILSSLIFIYLHILAVRTGILIAYAGLVCFFLLYLKKLNLKQIILIISTAVIIPFIAIKTIPTLKSKIDYASWEWSMFINGHHLNNSDSGRWISYEVGLEYFKSNPLFGIGPGDLEDEMIKTYHDKYPDVKVRKQPHNQFLHTLACSGILGLITFLLAFCIPLINAFKTNNKFFVVLIVATFASFMVESPLETARGTALIAFWLGIFLSKKEIKYKAA